MTDDKEKLGKVLAKLKIQLWADGVLVAESFDEKLWTQMMLALPLADAEANQARRLEQVVKDLQEKAVEFKAAEKKAQP